VSCYLCCAVKILRKASTTLYPFIPSLFREFALKVSGRQNEGTAASCTVRSMINFCLSTRASAPLPSVCVPPSSRLVRDRHDTMGLFHFPTIFILATGE